jgi:hypothetical protein
MIIYINAVMYKYIYIYTQVYLYQLLHTNYIYSFYILLHVSADILSHHQGVILYRLAQYAACH